MTSNRTNFIISATLMRKGERKVIMKRRKDQNDKQFRKQVEKMKKSMEKKTSLKANNIHLSSSITVFYNVMGGGYDGAE